MKSIIHTIVVVAFLGPLLPLVAETCCFIPEPGHSVTTGISSGETDNHFEAANTGCDENPCADCTLCHLPSFSPVTAEFRSQGFDAGGLLVKFSPINTEFVSTVPTPPPTI